MCYTKTHIQKVCIIYLIYSHIYNYNLIYIIMYIEKNHLNIGICKVFLKSNIVTIN